MTKGASPARMLLDQIIADYPSQGGGQPREEWIHAEMHRRTILPENADALAEMMEFAMGLRR